MKDSYFKAIVEAMEDLVYVCGKNFIIHYMNPAMKQYLGRSAVGERCHTAFFGSNTPCSWCRHKEVVFSQKIIRHELTCPHDKKIYNVTCIPVQFEEEKSDVSLTILHDITDIRMAQQQLEETNAQLRHMQKMQALAVLAAGIAHDFNNILGGVVGYTALLKELIGDDKGADYVKKIEDAALRASKLVERLMAFSIKGYKKKDVVNINDCVKEVLSILEQTVEKGISFDFRPSEGMECVYVSKTDIEHAIMNLCLNAVQAIEACDEDLDVNGTVTISTKMISASDVPDSAKRILTGGYCERYAVIEVSDDGCGLHEDELHRIFEPFYTTKSHSEAAGLGLSMVYSIMEAHEGLIDVDTRKGRGSVFSLYFPLVDADGVEKVELIEASEKQCLFVTPPSLKVLVVDDEPMLRELLKEVLEARKYSVLVASNGIEAIELYKKRRDEIGLIILDMIMPGMSGHEAFLELKKIDPDVRVVIASGYVDQHKVEQVKREGVLDFLAKPFSINEVLSKIERFLKK